VREFELIKQLTHRLAPTRADTLLGIGDDAALLALPAGQALVVTTDTLVSGRHFPVDTSAFDIGYKSVAVNLSDLAAMAATPAWLTLALAAPTLDSTWCTQLLDGALAAIGTSGVDIVGGDTTRSECLTITVTAMGYCPIEQAVRRDSARAGDVIAVTGTLGDAAAGLAEWGHGASDMTAHAAYLIDRLCRPSWRNGLAMRGQAHAACDISDGLCADLGHILAASTVGARLYMDALPTSNALLAYQPDADARQRLQLTGGDDYELCMTLPPAAVASVADALGCPLTIIGEIVAEPGLSLVDAQGAEYAAQTYGIGGWDHFAEL